MKDIIAAALFAPQEIETALSLSGGLLLISAHLYNCDGFRVAVIVNDIRGVNIGASQLNKLHREVDSRNEY